MTAPKPSENEESSSGRGDQDERLRKSVGLPDDAASAPPRSIGDFKIIQEIGRGGMGTVFEAEQVSLRRRVALKILPFHLSISEKAVCKFKREAEAGGRQHHPGIVAIHAVGKHEGLHYIAQELVEGSRSLEDRVESLRQADALPPGYFRDVAKCIAEVADALQHAHDTGVIHRDVKPANILLTKEGCPKITDFGLARIEDALALSRTGEFAGTPYYMSPEQALSQRIGIDHRTDIFSLGVTLYEMLTLQRPFEGETKQEVLKKIIVQEPRDPRKVNHRVPRDMAVICLKAMEKKPEARYAFMKEFAGDLRRFLSGDVIHAKPSGPVTRTLKYIRRNPVAGGMAGVALMALVTMLVWSIVYFIQLKFKNEEIRRLSDIESMFRLQAEAEALWPAYPQTVPMMRRWLDEVAGLEHRLDRHRDVLEDLQRVAAPNRDQVNQRRRIESYVAWLEGIRDAHTGLAAQVQDRLQFAETVHQQSVDDHGVEWAKAMASIAEAYGGLKIEPKPGFLPIDPDPDSELFEFVHIQTGTKPARGEDGRLEITEETGLVFVLIPGGTFDMGAVPPGGDLLLGMPNVDPYADEKYEGPVHPVVITPFLLSKYEMTQAQWLRMTGKNPSMHRPGEENDFSRLYPVEMVSWDDCVKWLDRMMLRLPTEAEWEYATRAGTTTVWWSGNEKESLINKANLADLSYKKYCDLPLEFHEDWLDDGYAYTAPVGSYAANPFGLHDVCGNVFEWCHDVFTDNYETTPVDGSAYEKEEDACLRVGRGGNWFRWGAKGCRSSFRGVNPPNMHAFTGGVRPAAYILNPE